MTHRRPQNNEHVNGKSHLLAYKYSFFNDAFSPVADLDGIDASDSAAQPIDRPRLSHTSTHRVHESKEDDRATQEDLAALEAELDVS
jgi:hypothetical protein